jgi:hypothetical protein
MPALTVPTKLVNLTKMKMGNNMGRVKIQGILSQPFIHNSEWFEASTLFNLALEYAARKLQLTQVVIFITDCTNIWHSQMTYA